MKKIIKKVILKIIRFILKSIILTVKYIVTGIDLASWSIQMALYNLTNGKITTKAVREEAQKRFENWERLRNETQALLDKEHASGKGFRYIDGKEIRFKPYTSKNI